MITYSPNMALSFSYVTSAIRERYIVLSGNIQNFQIEILQSMLQYCHLLHYCKTRAKIQIPVYFLFNFLSKT